MKIIQLLFLMSLFACVNTIHAQNANEATMQMVKESRKVDNLLDRYVDLGEPSSSCFVIQLEEYKDEYDLHIVGLRTDTSLLNLDIFQSKSELNFFRYKGYLVFVLNTGDPYHFFQKTRYSRVFKWQWDRKKSEEMFPMGRYFCNSPYYYEKERFYPILISDFPYKKTIKKLRVKIVKEDLRIDSLLDSYIGSEQPNNTCFLIRSKKTEHHYNLSIYKVKTDTSLLKLHIQLKSNLNFFTHKGYFIFVMNDGDQLYFFQETSLSETFKFELIEPSMPIPDNYFWSNNLIYKNGKFEPAVILGK